MADAPTVNLIEGAPQEVALRLTRIIAGIENKQVSGWYGHGGPVDRQWLLDTYAECLEATRGYRSKPK